MPDRVKRRATAVKSLRRRRAPAPELAPVAALSRADGDPTKNIMLARLEYHRRHLQFHQDAINSVLDDLRAAPEPVGLTPEEWLDEPVACLGIDMRCITCCEEAGIYTVRDLLNTPASELLRLPNFGQRYLDQVYHALARVGFPRRVAV